MRTVSVWTDTQRSGSRVVDRKRVACLEMAAQLRGEGPSQPQQVTVTKSSEGATATAKPSADSAAVIVSELTRLADLFSYRACEAWANAIVGLRQDSLRFEEIRNELACIRAEVLAAAGTSSEFSTCVVAKPE